MDIAYTPNTWAAGDTITAQKLNNMESGIDTATPLIVTFDASYAADTSLDDISSAFSQGRRVIARYFDEENESSVDSPLCIFCGDLFFNMIRSDGESVYVITVCPGSGTQWSAVTVTLSSNQ